MASSMTMPTASASASSVMMLSVKPMSHMPMKVPMIEVGIASAAMIVLRKLPRNSSTTSAASSAPSTRCSRTALTLVRVRLGVVADDGELRPAGQRALELLHALAERVDDGDAVLARLLADRQHDGRLAVDAARPSRPPPRRRRRARRRAPGSGWSSTWRMMMSPTAGDAGDAAAHAERQPLRPGVDRAARRGDVLRDDGALHVDGGEAVRAQLDRIEQHLDLALAAADDRHLADARDVLQRLAHLRGRRAR